MADAPSYRLPRTVIPERYELTLTPDLDEATFSGESRVRVRVTEAVNQVVLNAIELEIHSAELSDEAGTRVGSKRSGGVKSRSRALVRTDWSKVSRRRFILRSASAN